MIQRRLGVAMLLNLLLVRLCAAQTAALDSLQHDPFYNPMIKRPANNSAMSTEAAADPNTSTIETIAASHRLQMTLRAGAQSSAMIDGHRINLGEKLDGYTLISVQERAVTLHKSGKTLELQLEANHE